MSGPFERSARNAHAADELRKIANSIDLTSFLGHPRELNEVAIAISHVKAAAARFDLASKEAYREGDRCEEVSRG